MALRYPNATHYSKHYSRMELECKCGCKTPRRIKRRLRMLAVNLERFRKILGEPVGIRSGYRCSARNTQVGGAVNSQHIQGRAADLIVPAGRQSEFVLVANQVRAFRRGGIGVYAHGGVHVDMRGFRARWSTFRGQ